MPQPRIRSRVVRVLSRARASAKGGRFGPGEAKKEGRFARLSDLLAFRVSELRAAQEARTLVEGRYLDGHVALFPDVARAWEEQVRSTEAIADMAVRLAALDGVPPPAPPDPEAFSRRTMELVSDLVEPAKAEVLEKLGESDRALGIAAEWVRPKLAPKVADLA